ncbi:MAG TPA: phage portal protein [Gaiellaceae bacterium]|nr:phage portal protein [Gaiellaceae bacterium]
MIAERFARGIGAASWDGGPLPSPGVPGSLSGTPSTLGPQGLDLVPSRGEAVWATFRLIYLTNPWVHACVNAIATTIARMPICVLDIDPTNGDRVEVRYDWPITPGRLTGPQTLARQLDRPANGISRHARTRATMIDRLVLGNALWEMVGDGGMPGDLRRIPWRAVRNVPQGEDALALFYEVDRDLSLLGLGSPSTRKIAPIDVVHFGRGTDSELPVGVSPLASCRNTLRLHDAVMRSLIGWFTNSMKPSGHISVDKLTREKAKEIREMVLAAYASPENAGKVLVTSGTWNSTQGAPENSEVVQLLAESRDEVCAAYGVSTLVLGLLTGSRSAGNATTTIRNQYIRDTVGSWGSDFEGDIEAQLLPAVPSWSNLKVRCDMSAQLRPDLEAFGPVIKELVDTASVDDRREMLGLKPFREAWSRVPWSQPGAMPLDVAYTQPAAPARAGAEATDRAAEEDLRRLAADEPTDHDEEDLDD